MHAEKYNNNSFQKQIEKINVYKWKWMLIFLFIIPAVVFNIIFNVIINDFNSQNAGNYKIIFLLSTGVFMLFGFFFFLSKTRNFFIKSGAIILPVFWVLNNIFIPFVVAPILFGILGQFFHQKEQLNNVINMEGLFFQIVCYIGIVWYFFKFCTVPAKRFLYFIFPLKYEKKHDFYVKNAVIQASLIISGVVLCFMINLILGNLVKGNPSNQNAINNLMETRVGFILIVFLTLIFAPIVEELATRNAIIFPLISTDLNDKSLDNIQVNKTLTKNPFFYISMFLSILFFANMHVEFDHFINIVLYLGPAITLTIVYILGGFNVITSIFTHSIFNLIVLYFTIFSTK